MSNVKIIGISFAAGLAASLVYGYISSKKDEKNYVSSDDDICEDVEEAVESDEDSSTSEISESEPEHVQAETVDVDPTATVDNNKTVDVDVESTGKES